MAVIINGDTGIDKITDGSVVEADISTGAITQDKIASGVSSTGPAFSARLSTDPQSITTRTWTKVICGTEDFDTNSNYDSTTNYRFTPTVEGYYQINGIVRASGTIQDTYYVAIYKNGSAYTHVNSRTATSGSQSLSLSAVIYLNGSTDYVELYGWLEATSPQFESSTVTTFSGHLARGA